MNAHERHNRKTREFIQTVVRDVLEDGGKESDLMVMVESLLLGVMLLNVKVFGLQPHVSSGLVEAAVQCAIERFTEQMN